MSETDAVEYWVLRRRRKHGGRAARGRRGGRDLNRTPKGSLLQRDAVQYWMLCWRLMLLSTGFVLETDAVEYLTSEARRAGGGRRAAGGSGF